MIYLDNSATTKPNAACVQAMTRLLCDTWGNPSSVHELGIAAERELKNARKEVAASLGAEPDRVFFTSGGTEADNWAIFSTCERLKKRGNHIVTTAVEHHAVLHPFKALEARGFAVRSTNTSTTIARTGTPMRTSRSFATSATYGRSTPCRTGAGISPLSRQSWRKPACWRAARPEAWCWTPSSAPAPRRRWQSSSDGTTSASS